ncbi:AMP-binding protein, partial [Nocardia amikacinitolerans]|uniref:AMP-binding protein n=1 Tax=Nocardia amikacinitolerans TaxID=756689 RepID=UPI0020A41ECF
GVTVSSSRDKVPDSVDWLVLDDPALAAWIDASASGPIGDDERARPLRAADVAYVIFTSGSTGVPKGVAVTHSGIADLVSVWRADPELRHTSRVLHFASPSFDAALMEILIAISRAAALVVAPNGIYGGGELAEFLRVRRVTHATTMIGCPFRSRTRAPSGSVFGTSPTRQEGAARRTLPRVHRCVF